MYLCLCQAVSEAEITASNNNSLPHSICQEQLAERTRRATYHQHAAWLLSRVLLLACHWQTAGCGLEPSQNGRPGLAGGRSRHESHPVNVGPCDSSHSCSWWRGGIMQQVIPKSQIHTNKNPEIAWCWGVVCSLNQMYRLIIFSYEVLWFLSMSKLSRSAVQVMWEPLTAVYVCSTGCQNSRWGLNIWHLVVFLHPFCGCVAILPMVQFCFSIGF